jgi:hypothetical protein
MRCASGRGTGAAALGGAAAFAFFFAAFFFGTGASKFTSSVVLMRHSRDHLVKPVHLARSAASPLL